MYNKKSRIPRKLKNKIPKGVYCYTFISRDPVTYDSKIKCCPFHTSIQNKNKPIPDEIDLEFPDEYVGWCKLIKYEVYDQCKSCGIKHEW